MEIVTDSANTLSIFSTNPRNSNQYYYLCSYICTTLSIGRGEIKLYQEIENWFSITTKYETIGKLGNWKRFLED